MHHHRLVLNGPPPAVARLAEELRRAGAVAVDGGRRPARLVWTTRGGAALEALCARHRGVVVGVERFETLGAELERLVVCGHEATVLERRGFAVDGSDGELEEEGELDQEGEPLDRAALRRAALGVAAMPVAVGPPLAGTSVDDALLVGPAIGRLCVAAADPAGATEAIRSLAAVGLTIGASASRPACAAELAFERAWRLTQATAFAGQEALWSRPGDAEWPDWLMFVLSCAAGVIESCAASAHRAPPDVKSVHAEHFATADEHLEHAAGLLVMVALQALVLFAGGCDAPA